MLYLKWQIKLLILQETNKNENWPFLLEAKKYPAHRAYLQVSQALQDSFQKGKLRI